METSRVHSTSSFEGYQTKILVVDDEEAVRELLRDLLESENCRVYLAPGGREALTFLRRNNSMAFSPMSACRE